jgi:hypothetical protein
MTADEQKDRIRYFYEVVVSQNQLDRLYDYVADDCTVRVEKQSMRVELPE